MVSADDGTTLAQRQLPPPLWDGMAIAEGRLFYTTADGQLLCIGQADR